MPWGVQGLSARSHDLRPPRVSRTRLHPERPAVYHLGGNHAESSAHRPGRRLAVQIWAPLEGKEYAVIPDALFGIEYPDKGFRFFALEADRGTEPLTRKNYYQTSYKKKLLLYRSIVTLRSHETHWKIPNLYVLNVTTSAERMENIKKLTLDLTGGRGNSVMLFKVHKGTAFSGPPADGHVLTEPWGRAGYPMFDVCVSAHQAFFDMFFSTKGSSQSSS